LFTGLDAERRQFHISKDDQNITDSVDEETHPDKNTDALQNKGKFLVPF